MTSSSKIRVLIAEDQTMLRGALAALLSLEPDLTVIAEAANGREAHKLTLTLAPDVVVTDIEMPDMDGFELAQALRENPTSAAIPVIALSAMISSEAIERGRRVGFHDFVAKFDRTGLIAAIKEQTDDLHQAA